MRHRPHSRDAEDPDVAEALRLVQSDPALAEWLAEYQRSQNSIHRALTSIHPPAGLLEQILTERPRPTRPATVHWRRVTTGTFLVIVVGLVGLWLIQPHGTEFERFATRMVKTALRTYSMDLETNDAALAKTFLANAGAPADYELPPGLAETPLVGCSALQFDGRPVTLLCFQTGKPLPPGAQSDLWLFVIPSDAVTGAPETLAPEIQQRSLASLASWSKSGRTYLLVTSGSEADLRQLL